MHDRLESTFISFYTTVFRRRSCGSGVEFDSMCFDKTIKDRPTEFSVGAETGGCSVQ